jgi:hypothetical protein
VENAGGRTTATGPILFNAIEITAGGFDGMVRLDPQRNEGMGIPTGKITDRRPNRQVVAGALKFPALYALGQMDRLHSPLCRLFYTAEDDGTTFTVAFSGISVSVTSAFGTGTTSGTAVLSGVNPDNETFWQGIAERQYGGWMRDGRQQFIGLHKCLMDSTMIGSTGSHGGATTTQPLASFEAVPENGRVYNLIQAYRVAPGFDNWAILVQAHD